MNEQNQTQCADVAKTNAPARVAVIPPTVGRVVWYWPGPNDSGNYPHSEPRQPHAATVAYVWSDHMVNLSIVDHSGNQYSRTSVRLVQPGDDNRPVHGYCSWMPYQVGQAAKAEASEKSALELGAAARAVGPARY